MRVAKHKSHAIIVLLSLALCDLTWSRPNLKDIFTFSCLPLTTQRSDPIMSPGKPSSHTHVVTGGTAFQRTMNDTTAKNAKDTTCAVAIDKSNYWIPQLYHRRPDGSFEIVKHEGTAIYYFKRACHYAADKTSCEGTEYPRAPPAGLRMVAGDMLLRTYNDSDITQRAISHMCIGSDGSSTETKHFPLQPCSKLRSQVFLPSCWDGENLDSSDHKRHMAYPVIGDFNKGICPETHPVAIYSIFLEFFYDTEPYPDYHNWIYAMGDPTGFGLHGDFINGWTDQDALQNAMTTCTGPDGLNSPECSITKSQKRDLVPLNQTPEVHAPIEELGQNGLLPRLPGNNPVTIPRQP
ncbi:hypothetical protein BDV25DRAFT_171181 [Aspergillus avenaceus]|uniref:DUF1996 domain-containing protein n=1 Tax=Aspergillus avenaceus TaxID=36643 RepID=A0A5N6TEE4_ASPAV|nr:hypothetical protein BDV25DRAFT_171181 [Aspergillus avenaceus]